jgi:hypothetical protein
MLITPLQPQYKVRINIRPVKHAYFVYEDDVDSLTSVLRFVCTQWGGIRSLIIPVRRDLTIKNSFLFTLRSHEPDRFVAYMPDVAAPESERLETYINRLWPYKRVTITPREEFERADRSAHALHPIPEEELRNNTLVSYEFPGEQADHWILLALFGQIFDGQQPYYSDTVGGLQTRPIGVDSENFWESQHETSAFSSVLNLTSYGFSAYEGDFGIGQSFFDVVLVDSCEGLCAYWDFRATAEATQIPSLKRRTLLLPASLLGNCQALERLANFVRANFYISPFYSNLHIRFWVTSDQDEARARGAVGAVTGLEELTGRLDNRIFAGGYEQPAPEVIAQMPVKYSFFKTDEAFTHHIGGYLESAGHQVPVSTGLGFGRNEVFFSPPEGFRSGGGETAVDFVSDVWARYPRNHEIAEHIKPNAWFSRYGVTFITQPPARANYLDFNLPTEFETLRLFFSSRGYDVNLSKPATYANALVGLMGGVEQLPAIATKPAYLLLDSLALKSTKKLAQKIAQQLAENLKQHEVNIPTDMAESIQPHLEDMEIVPELKRIPKTYSQLSSDARLSPYKKELLPLLSLLSERQVVTRGFYLACTNCETQAWYPLRVIHERVLCLGCFTEFTLPVEKPKAKEIEWEYTLNTLVNRIMDQDALVAVLAISHLAKGREICCVVPGLELRRADDPKGQAVTDFDFIFVSQQQIFAGECKAGTELGDKDLRTAQLAAELGVRNFYFCTVKQFSAETTQRVEELNEELSESFNMDIEMLNGAELLGEAVS